MKKSKWECYQEAGLGFNELIDDSGDEMFRVWEALHYGEDSPLCDMDKELWIKAFQLGRDLQKTINEHERH